jgi:two-component system nitrogen regulation sensor histidine kinase NtrY
MISDLLLPAKARYVLLGLVIALSFGGGYFIAHASPGAMILCLAASLLAAIFLLWHYQATHKSILYFFESLRNEDTTLQFPSLRSNSSLNRVYESMNQFNRHFQEIRIQQESQERYYRALIRNAATGLLVLRQNNQVELINETACRYAGISAESTNPALLSIKNPAFNEAACRLRPGEKVTYRQVSGNEIQILLFRAVGIQREEERLKLISIQDIRQELESREIDSYRKLIRVLTHEIMNLIAPVTSVANTLHDLYHPADKPISNNQVNKEILQTTLNSVAVIREQSNGLVHFMNSYRKITRVPQPVIRPIDLEDWINQLRIAFSGQMMANHIRFEITAVPGIRVVEADKNLMNQVLINLINNAVEAIESEKDKMIRLSFEHSPSNRVRIIVFNNGPSIPTEIQEKIFVPFFTTKNTGSGIGLSLSQEIIRQHKGSLVVVSETEGHTSFIIEI